MKRTILPSGYVETWYDRQSRNWITTINDVDGNQIGDAEFAGSRASALFDHARIIAEYIRRERISARS